MKAHDRAIEIDLQDTDAWCCKGCALYNLGKYYKAIEAYDKITEWTAPL